MTKKPFRDQATKTGFILAILAAAIPIRAQTASAAPAPAAGQDVWGLAPPAWLSASSVTVKVGYDSDIFGTAVNLAGHPAIANVSSEVTTLSANLSFDLLAGAGPRNDCFLSSLTFGYAADYAIFNKAASEDNLRNTFTLQLKGKSGPWSLSIDNPLVYVYGSKEDPFYSIFTPPGFSAALQRRNQIQERNTSTFRYDAPDWFFRAVDSALYLNMLIDEHNPVGIDKGYLNWVNRDDVNVGSDVGYKLIPDFAFTAGWRVGSQTQAKPYYSLVSNSSTYNRALFGFEGTVFPWLKASFVAGPDFRRYDNSAHLGLTGDRHTWLYTESTLSATFSPLDTVTAANKVWHFVAAPGLTSDQETTDSLIYKHGFTKELSASAGVRILGQHFDAPTVRNDWATTFPVSVAYVFNKGLLISADYSATLGRTHFPDAVTPGRDWDENLVSVSAKASF
jgi:hypothetical protein